jgi:hypothetical protein
MGATPRDTERQFPERSGIPETGLKSLIRLVSGIPDKKVPWKRSLFSRLFNGSPARQI